MVVGVKDSDMEDSDAYVVEDTVVDYAMVWFITPTNNTNINIKIMSYIKEIQPCVKN